MFAFDVADLTENIDREVVVGGRIGASAEQSVAQIRKLKQIATESGLPAGPRARPGRLARAHRGTGRSRACRSDPGRPGSGRRTRNSGPPDAASALGIDAVHGGHPHRAVARLAAEN